MSEQRVGFDEDGATVWTVREPDWCPACFAREAAEGLAVCIMCAADQSP